MAGRSTRFQSQKNKATYIILLTLVVISEDFENLRCSLDRDDRLNLERNRIRLEREGRMVVRRGLELGGGHTGTV